MVDVTPEKGAGFEHGAKVFNLKQSAKSVTELERYGFRSLEDLQTAIAAAKADERDCREALKTVEADLYGKNELLKRVLAYANTKPIRDEYPTKYILREWKLENEPKREPYYGTEPDGEMYFYIGNTRIKVSEHFAKGGKPLENLLEDIIKYSAKSSL